MCEGRREARPKPLYPHQSHGEPEHQWDTLDKTGNLSAPLPLRVPSVALDLVHVTGGRIRMRWWKDTRAISQPHIHSH